MKKSSVSIFILIDALGWDYIKDRPFLGDIAVTKKSVKSILGFSSGVIPSILTGRYPQEHKHWSLYFYSPETSPFRWTKDLLWLPKKVLNSRISRKIIEEISKRIMGYRGYFETYRIPVENLHLFDICENRNIYAPKGIRDSDSIFDIWHKKGSEYKSFAYPLKDKDIFIKAKESLNNSRSSYYFLYLSESDGLLHRSCQDKKQVDAMIDYYDREMRGLYATAKENFREVKLYVFSDHSMAPVNNGLDLEGEIDSLGFRMPEDYIAFYDSTMARFWFFNSKAKEAIINVLKDKNYGRILSDKELKELGLSFEDNMYGELIFLMNMGSVICPSFMGSKAPQGMHGFGVDGGTMDAMLLSNQEIRTNIRDVRDFFQLMSPNKKIKIMYFLNSSIRGGAEEHVLRLIEGLDKKIFEPVLVLPQKLIDVTGDDLNILGIRYYSVSIRRWHNLGEIKRFLHVLKEEKPDIVHSHLFRATMFAAPLAKFAKVSTVIETAHIREAWRRGIKKAYFIDRFFYRFTDKIIAVSNAVKNYLIAEKKISPEKIEVIHNGVDINKFSPKHGDSPLRGQSPKFHVGVIGRLEPQKGHGYFLEAVSMLNNDNFKYFIVGDGSLRQELEDRCRELKIDDKVEFLGVRNDIASVFNELDLAVLPSLYEGLPLIALEASAMARPVVVTDVDGSPEVIMNGQTGSVVPAKDPMSLAKAMAFFYENRDIAKKYGQEGREFVRQQFDIKEQVRKTEALYMSSIKD